MEDFYFIECPYCKAGIEILKSELNCKIFRHATLKDPPFNVNPHASREEINKLKIYGCGMPFYFDGIDIKYIDFSDKFIEDKLVMAESEKSDL